MSSKDLLAKKVVTKQKTSIVKPRKAKISADAWLTESSTNQSLFFDEKLLFSFYFEISSLLATGNNLYVGTKTGNVILFLLSEAIDKTTGETVVNYKDLSKFTSGDLPILNMHHDSGYQLLFASNGSSIFVLDGESLQVKTGLILKESVINNLKDNSKASSKERMKVEEGVISFPELKTQNFCLDVIAGNSSTLHRLGIFVAKKNVILIYEYVVKGGVQVEMSFYGEHPTPVPVSCLYLIGDYMIYSLEKSTEYLMYCIRGEHKGPIGLRKIWETSISPPKYPEVVYLHPREGKPCGYNVLVKAGKKVLPQFVDGKDDKMVASKYYGPLEPNEMLKYCDMHFSAEPIYLAVAYPFTAGVIFSGTGNDQKSIIEFKNLFNPRSHEKQRNTFRSVRDPTSIVVPGLLSSFTASGSMFFFAVQGKVFYVATPPTDFQLELMSNEKLVMPCNKLSKMLHTTTLFGVNLEKVMQRKKEANGKIPRQIMPIMKYLMQHGPTLEGIFRINGKKEIIGEMTNILDSGADLDLSKYADQPHAISSIFKNYLRALPEPLLTYPLFEDFLSLPKMSDTDKQMAELKRLIKKLPTVNRYFLFYLLELCSVIRKEEKENMMSSQNLAIVFGINCLRSVDNEKDVSSTNNIQSAFQLMIELFPKFFDEDVVSLAIRNSYCVDIDKDITNADIA